MLKSLSYIWHFIKEKNSYQVISFFGAYYFLYWKPIFLTGDCKLLIKITLWWAFTVQKFSHIILRYTLNNNFKLLRKKHCWYCLINHKNVQETFNIRAN